MDVKKVFLKRGESFSTLGISGEIYMKSVFGASDLIAFFLFP
jgi:hypothetical protein